MGKEKYEIDMCNGPLLKKIVVFSVPLMLSGVLQLLFNAADVAVVGRFAGSEALAAVGSTSALTILLVNLFVGLSVGANILVARYHGGGQTKDVAEVVHTSVILSVVAGVLLAVIGFFLAEPVLVLMRTPENVIGQAVLYMRIYFAGMPVMLLYNFGSAILRAVGDTKRPLTYLTIAGIVNVSLNMVLVIGFHMGVAGVAIPTVISQCISAVFVMRCLAKSQGSIRLEKSKLHISWEKVGQIIKIGLPAGIQSSLFSLSNVLIQATINPYGGIVIAGNTAASNIEGFVYSCMFSLHQTAVTFIGQNFGAGKLKRIPKIMVECLIGAAFVGILLGGGATLWGSKLLHIYSADAEVIQYGVYRMMIVCTTHFLCGIMEVLVGSIRGLGYSVMPMLVSLVGVCVFRIFWVYTIYQWRPSLQTLYISYPISWALTILAHSICFMVIYRKMLRTHTANGKYIYP